jgi:alkylated DNA repair protein (DNA oxidative demethylase)
VNSRARREPPRGLLYDPRFVTRPERKVLIDWLATLSPLWEMRYSARNPPPEGFEQRRLLRPVYWLGNWQFACLDYFRPPDGVADRCVQAEPFPPVLARMARDIEEMTKQMFAGPPDLPRAWHLNTCLVNFYGTSIDANGKREDVARVGEHKDFEPGPVASISLGERALFQFVTSRARGSRDEIVQQQWLDDGSLQIFGGAQWKKQTFHRVQRVDRKGGHRFEIRVPGFETRRVNFTFRWVPDEHVTPFAKLSKAARDDVREYVEQLAQHSKFFASALEAEKHEPVGT